MSKKILLVDDSKTVLMFEKLMLQGMGYQLDTANNGLQALDAVKQNKPDLIMLDIMMPELNGIETCRRIKNDPNTSGIPIVMVTTKGEEDMVARAVEAGCDAYLTKPLDKIALNEKLRQFLGN